MIDFVDPRSNPEPPARVSHAPAARGEELHELTRLCQAGYLYDVERWIQEGRPIQALTYNRPKKPTIVSPLRTAIRRKNRDLVLLLLCNGYRLDLEANTNASVLDEALEARDFEILALLLKWGADPAEVRPCNVLATYRTDVIDTFWNAGVDYSADPQVPIYLAQTVNKPLYGWLRRNRADQRLQNALDVALLEAVMADKELPVRLLLWAGADPHRKVPMARELGSTEAWEESAIFSSGAAAITFGRHQFFDLLRIGAMPDLEEQFSWAHDSWTLKKLVSIRPPTDWSGAILAFIGRLWRPFGSSSSWDVRDALGFIASSGGKLTTASSDQVRHLRRVLFEVAEADLFVWLLRWLKNQAHCEPVIYQDLTRTASMCQRIQGLRARPGYLPPFTTVTRVRGRSARKRRAEEKSQYGGGGTNSGP